MSIPGPAAVQDAPVIDQEARRSTIGPRDGPKVIARPAIVLIAS